jgi:hypothetical protein
MRYIAITITIAAMTLLGQSMTMERDRDQQRPAKQDTVNRLENRRDLGLEYASAAKLKLASRKKTYHLGEMISLDLAMLNTTKAPIFFSRLLQPNFYVRDHRGNSMDIVPYLVVESAPSPDLYALIQPDEIMTKSFDVLAGCDKKAFENLNNGIDDRDGKDLFERDRFVNWGQLCLKVAQPGTYSITIEQNNHDVVISANGSNAKTAIGVIRSTPLTIEIIR